MAILGTTALILFTADCAAGLVTKGTMIYKGKNLFKKRDWRDIMQGSDDELSMDDYVDQAIEKLEKISSTPKKEKEKIKNALPEEVQKIEFNDILNMGKTAWENRKVIKVVGKTILDNPKIILDLALTQEYLADEHKVIIARVYGILMKIHKRKERI